VYCWAYSTNSWMGTLRSSATFLVGVFHLPSVALGLLTLDEGAITTFNSSLQLGEEGIESVLMTLHSIRQRALSKLL